ncbi:hypothetical protein Tco_0799811 [Tanacetum coccineum]|uniref:Uncharacterized protein n=1 Tax=Tanacetum coccineum TaxID=301880 RepID=A0ABQ4ZVS4_9ASTR
MTYPCHWFSEQVGLAGDLGSTNDVLIPLENELNNDPEEPWSKNGVFELIDHLCEPFRFKNGNTKWPTYSSNEDGFFNGGELPGMVRVGYMTYFQDYKWTYATTNIDDNYNPYLDASRTFNNHAGGNDEEAIRGEGKPNNDHGIDNFDNDLVRDSTT